jgi:hypothetical protein
MTVIVKTPTGETQKKTVPFGKDVRLGYGSGAGWWLRTKAEEEAKRRTEEEARRRAEEEAKRKAEEKARQELKAKLEAIAKAKIPPPYATLTTTEAMARKGIPVGGLTRKEMLETAWKQPKPEITEVEVSQEEYEKYIKEQKEKELRLKEARAYVGKLSPFTPTTKEVEIKKRIEYEKRLAGTGTGVKPSTTVEETILGWQKFGEDVAEFILPTREKEVLYVEGMPIVIAPELRKEFPREEISPLVGIPRGAIQAVVTAPAAPLTLAHTGGALIAEPIPTATAITKGIAEKPYEFAGSLLGWWILGKGIGKLSQAVKPKLGLESTYEVTYLTGVKRGEKYAMEMILPKGGVPARYGELDVVVSGGEVRTVPTYEMLGKKADITYLGAREGGATGRRALASVQIPYTYMQKIRAVHPPEIKEFVDIYEPLRIDTRKLIMKESRAATMIKQEKLISAYGYPVETIAEKAPKITKIVSKPPYPKTPFEKTFGKLPSTPTRTPEIPKVKGDAAVKSVTAVKPKTKEPTLTPAVVSARAIEDIGAEYMVGIGAAGSILGRGISPKEMPVELSMQPSKASSLIRPAEIIKAAPKIKQEELALQKITPSISITAPSVSIAQATPQIQVEKIEQATQKIQVTKLTPKQMQRQRIAAQTITPQIQITGQPGFPRIEISHAEDLISTRKDRKKGYIVLLKRHGRFMPITVRPMARGQALYVGKKAAEQTLGATFKLEKAGKLIPSAAPEISEKALTKFRTYRIEKGRKVPLEDTFIQEARYRLSHRQEVAEIQRARKAKEMMFGKNRRKIRLI